MYSLKRRQSELDNDSSNPLIIALLVVFAVIYLFSYLIIPKVTLTPEENVRTHYQRLSFEQNRLTLSYTEPLNQTYDTELIKPRNVVTNDAGQIVPSDFLGIYLIFLPITKIIGLELANAFLFSALSTLGLAAVYLLTKHFFDTQAALLATAVVGAFPVYFYWAERIMTDIPSLAFCLLGLYYLVKHQSSFLLRYAALAGLFIGIGVSIKYTNLILVGIFGLIFLPYARMLTKRAWAFYGVCAAGFAVTMLPIVLLNQQLYGGILKTGQQAYSGSAKILRTSADISIVDNAFKYFVSFAGIVTILFAISCALIIKYGAAKHVKLMIFAAVYGLFNILFFGKANDVFGAQAPDVLLSHSQPRYFLGVFIFIIIIAISSIALFKRASIHLSHFTRIVALLLVPGYFIGAFSFNGSGFTTVRKEAQVSTRLRDSVLSSTGENSIVFTQFNDKLIFPDRRVVSYYNAGLDSLSERSVNAATLANRMVEDKREVYWLSERVNKTTARERGYGSLADYEAQLAKNRLALTPVNKYLYKVERTR
jgi:Dolichyl-phosphate-mannose-protein mannosyltransferase